MLPGYGDLAKRSLLSPLQRLPCCMFQDLVNEKIKTQLLSNELDNLTEELEKVGLNKEKIIAMEQAEDER